MADKGLGGSKAEAEPLDLHPDTDART